MTDLIQTGDTFEGEWFEWTVITTEGSDLSDAEVKVENCGGLVETKEARELIEMVTQKREPVNL